MSTIKEITDRIKRADMEPGYNAITPESMAYKLLAELPIQVDDSDTTAFFGPWLTMDREVFISVVRCVMEAEQFKQMERIYNGQVFLLQALSAFKITTEEDMSKLRKLVNVEASVQ
jgi:hypothetical protein